MKDENTNIPDTEAVDTAVSVDATTDTTSAVEETVATTQPEAVVEAKEVEKVADEAKEVKPEEEIKVVAPVAPARTFPPRGAAGAMRGRRPAGPGGATGGRPGGRPGGRGPRPERVKPEFDQKILDIRRVVRVVSGGRRFSFSVSIAIGDKNGRVGLGSGKSSDTSLAIEKAIKDAKKKMITLKLNKNNSIPHDLSAKFASSKIFMMPNKSRGLIAGSSARVLLNLAGVKDVTAKFFSGSKNKMNNGKVAMKALELIAYKYGEQKIAPKVEMVETEAVTTKTV